MSPRKRPLCHTCGSPMAGHKRPRGSPVCPGLEASPPPSPAGRNPLRRTAAVADFEIPDSGYWHRRNPNWVEREASPVDDEHHSTSSWVHTEPAEDAAADRAEEQLRDEDKVSGEDDDYHSVSDSSSSQSTASSSSVKRSLTGLLMTSRHLASLFSTPPEAIPAVTRAARKHGLTTGLIRRPLSDQGQDVKSEDNDVPIAHGTNLGRQSSWWMVMGQDPEAVSHLLDLHQGDAEGHLGQTLHSRTKGNVGAYPVDVSSIRPTFLDVIIAGAIGGFVVLYGLSML
ncbi:hypothetical protein AcW1_004743 [Taiwanofungus camphoratus]|nr:hypothetical protein AcW1_004743 [Antrodia cinnamomea]